MSEDDSNINQATDDPVGLYVHIPFCETKCGYCDFYSVALKDRDTLPLVNAVIRELDYRLADSSLPIQTVFCGGGTPTILPVDQLEKLLKTIVRYAPANQLSEFTVEANPATVDGDMAALMVKSGVTRVSMGAQSFFPSELETLERIHSPDDIAPSVKILRDAGVQQINLDLIFGIPGQTMKTWSSSLQQAVALKPDHIACYGLTYEPQTRLTAMKNSGRIIPSDEQLEADMFLHTIDFLASEGYPQYEISNYAKEGCESKHNLIYWRNQPYYGVGPSAAGCINERRYKNIADVGGYVQSMEKHHHAEAEVETIDNEMLMYEMVMMQLRLVEGLSIKAFHDRTGSDPLELFGDYLGKLVEEGFVSVSPTHIALTLSGRLIANAIIAEFAWRCDRGDISLPIVESK